MQSSAARSRRAVSLRTLAGCAVLALLGSCANMEVTTSQYAGAPRPAATKPADVEILRTEPVRPHERLGEIVIDATTDPAPPIEKVEQRVREEGAKLGADAVVVVVDRIQNMGSYVSGPWWGSTVEPIVGRKLIGVAIKYKS